MAERTVTVPRIATGRGSATAEFAILMPAVCIVLAVCLSGLQLATQYVQVNDAAALAARSASRGEDASALVNRLVPEASMHSDRRGNLLCVRVDVSGAPMARLLGFTTVSGTSCALADGR